MMTIGDWGFWQWYQACVVETLIVAWVMQLSDCQCLSEMHEKVWAMIFVFCPVLNILSGAFAACAIVFCIVYVIVMMPELIRDYREEHTAERKWAAGKLNKLLDKAKQDEH